MANCGTIAGISRACRDNAGGVRKFYIATVADFNDVSFDEDGAGTITGFTGTESLSAYTYSTNKNSSNFVENYQSSVENGTVGYEQVATLVFSKMEAAKRNQVLLLAQSDIIIIAEDRNGKYWLLGETEGVTLSGGNSQSGVALSDLNGYNLTFTGMEPSPAQEVSVTALESILQD